MTRDCTPPSGPAARAAPRAPRARPPAARSPPDDEEPRLKKATRRGAQRSPALLACRLQRAQLSASARRHLGSRRAACTSEHLWKPFAHFAYLSSRSLSVLEPRHHSARRRPRPPGEAAPGRLRGSRSSATTLLATALRGDGLGVGLEQSRAISCNLGSSRRRPRRRPRRGTGARSGEIWGDAGRSGASAWNLCGSTQTPLEKEKNAGGGTRV